MSLASYPFLFRLGDVVGINARKGGGEDAVFGEHGGEIIFHGGLDHTPRVCQSRSSNSLPLETTRVPCNLG
jgi:hypothetical protein